MSATTTATGRGGFAACQARLNAKAQAWAGFAACNDRLLVAHEAGNAFYRAIQKVLGHLVCRPNVGGQFIQALKKDRSYIQPPDHRGGIGGEGVFPLGAVF